VAIIEMEIDSIRMALMSYQRVVILKEKDGERYLPIWIGPADADSIAIKLREITVPRPLTHDMVCTIIEVLGGRLEKVLIDKLENDTFESKMMIEANDKVMKIDCRPSDAIAVAVRAEAPIFVEREVLDKAGVKTDDIGNIMSGK
jgi:bifunctional DNase/RNase